MAGFRQSHQYYRQQKPVSFVETLVHHRISGEENRIKYVKMCEILSEGKVNVDIWQAAEMYWSVTNVYELFP